MLRLNNRVRFTDAETDKLLTIGINLIGVRTQSDVNAEFARWANALARKRPDLLEMIACDLKRALQQQPEIAYDDAKLETSC
jgi:hypothetical protein